MTRIVGIGGKLAAGKDEVADHLVREYGWVKIGMSDALAEMMYTLNPIIPTDADAKDRKGFKLFTAGRHMRYQELIDRVGYVQAKENTEVRRLLQVLGTEVGRKQIDADLWTNMMIKKVKAAAATAPGVIVTGIRFDNELDAISDTLGGELWWVSRPGTASSNAAHASENSVEAADFDRCIWNTGSLEDLYQKVDDLVANAE